MKTRLIPLDDTAAHSRALAHSRSVLALLAPASSDKTAEAKPAAGLGSPEACGAEFFLWPDGGTCIFHGEKNTQWEGGYRAPCNLKHEQS